MKMNRRRALACLGGTITAGTVLRHAHAAEFQLKWGTSHAPNFPSNLAIQRAAAAIKEETAGRVQVQLFHSGQLGSDTDMFSQLRSGALDFYITTGPFLGAIVPVAGITGVGFAFSDYGKVWDALDGDLGKHIRSKLIANAGVYPFDHIWDLGYRQISSKSKPIVTPDDLSGFKIRVAVVPIILSLFKALGASPTALNFAEVYSALQTGLVDGQENPVGLIYNSRFYEVQKYISVTNHLWDGLWPLASTSTWQRLPANLQEIVAKHVNEAGRWQRVESNTANEKLRKSLADAGLQFVNADIAAFQAKLKARGYYAEWRKTFGDESWSILERYTGSLA
ncbi:MAG: TRAP transporter substrate-binding protein [Rhizobiaceae bacterium]